MTLFSLALMLPAQAEPLEQYAQRCDLATGTTVPAFDCDDGTLIPTTNLVSINGRLQCDEPNRLNGVCDPNSRILVLEDSDEASVVGLCRKKGNAPGKYGDVAVIQTNKLNGATCFYQTLGVLDHEVPAPIEGTQNFWYTPAATASIGCAGCHDNGALIRSPYLSSIQGRDALPGAGDNTWNAVGDPYWFVGDDFNAWEVFETETSNSTCTSCHRMGSNRVALGMGGSGHLAERATSASESSQTPGRAPWMLPGSTAYSSAMASIAQGFASCNDQLTQMSAPTNAACTIVPTPGLPNYGGAANPTVAAGVWQSSGGREASHQGNARFLLTIDIQTTVRLDLLSGTDTYLYLMDRRGTAVIVSDDDSGPAFNAKIVRSLPAGDYIVVAATYSAGEADDFDLTTSHGMLRPMAHGEWTGSAGRDIDSPDNGFFRFHATETSADIALAAPGTDTYLYLMDSRARQVGADDDSLGTLMARLQQSVTRGKDYIVSATTFLPGVYDDYTLDAKGGRLYPAVQGSWSGSGGSDPFSPNNPTFLLDMPHAGHVQIDLMSGVSSDSMLYLTQGSSTILASDDDGGDFVNARMSVRLDAGTYVVTAATYTSGETDDFYISTTEGTLTPWF